MKRNLLQKIKEHKERNITPTEQNVENKNQENIEIGKFSSEFQDSMKYLKELTQKPLINQINNLFNNHNKTFYSRTTTNTTTSTNTQI